MTEINPINSAGQYSDKKTQKTDSKDTHIKESLFTKLDKDKNGSISREELKAAGYTGKDLVAMEDAIFKAERNVNKWMRIDLDGNGEIDNVEDAKWTNHNTDGGHLNGDLTTGEFGKKYNIKKNSTYKGDDFESWCKTWIEDDNPMVGIRAGAKEFYGRELTEEETQLLYDAMKMQANRWLFKENALYGRLNLDAYTRLATPVQTDSCCGGDLSKPPMAPQNSCALVFGSLEADSDTNSASEMKNRLAWAAFKALPKEETDAMTSAMYRMYQAEWKELRNMKASDFRALLKPENSAARQKFEKNSNMTVQQIVDYIDIVERSTGKNFDSNDWSVDTQTFFRKILPELNGTDGDDTILKGKTRADVPPEKQEWLNYLEQHNMLLDQFKK